MSTKSAFDALLVVQFQSGDNNALGILVKRHHKKFCNQAYWYTKNVEISKDIAQDSWGVIIKKLKGLRDPNCFSSWALRIVTRKSLDFIRQHGNREVPLKSYGMVGETEPHETADNEVQILRKAIKRLPEDQQIVLRLFYTQEYSLKEIAEILNLSVGTVKSRLYHAREKLKKILKT